MFDHVGATFFPRHGDILLREHRKRWEPERTRGQTGKVWPDTPTRYRLYERSEATVNQRPRTADNDSHRRRPTGSHASISSHFNGTHRLQLDPHR